MRLRIALGVGVPLAVVAAVATALGPDRLRSLPCHVGACSALDRTHTLCALYEATADVPPLARPLAIQARLERSWPTSKMRALWAKVTEASPGAAYDPILDALEAEGFGGFECGAFERDFAAPVALTPRRLIVHGRTLAWLQQGRVPKERLGLDGLEIEGLQAALAYAHEGAPIRVSAPQDQPIETLQQLIFSLGLAGVPQAEVVAHGAAPMTMQFHLPAYGACAGCPLPPSAARRQPVESAAVALLGRQGTGAEPIEPSRLATLVLPPHGEHRVLSSHPTGSGPDLAVLADPARTWRDLARALRLEVGPLAAPAYARVLLTVIAPPGGPGPELATLIEAPALLTPPAPRAEPARVASKTTRSQVVARAARASRPGPTPRGPTSERALHRQLQPKLRSIKACYERALKVDTFLAGKVTLQFEIGPTGRTSRVQLQDHSLNSEAVTRCIERRVRTWRLPAPEDAPVAVTYPLVFAPMGS